MPFLSELVVVFCLSIAVLLFCYKLHIPSIVGFLITGVICGPTALQLVEDIHAVDLLAEMGVVLLLFTIGMEMSGGELKRLKKPILFGGGGQVFLTITSTACFAFIFSSNFAHNIFFGFLVALSSTAIVLSLLQQKAQMEAPQGRLCLAILIFQDIVIVPMMLAIPFLAGSVSSSPMEMALSGIKDFSILVAIVVGGKFGLPPLMRLIMQTRSRELLLLATLGITFAIALMTSYAGLSLSLGAFIAGVLLAESEYSLSVLENVLPFKDVFTSVFFISVGMLLDVPYFFSHIGFVLMIAGLLILLKISLIYPIIRFLGYSPKTAVLVAFSLAQIGEFSFVLARSGLSNNLIDNNLYQLFLAGSIITMVLTPVLMAVAGRFADYITNKFYANVVIANDDDADSDEHEKMSGHLLIIGFGVGGKNLAKVSKEAGIQYSILEANPDTVARFRDIEPIKHGDASLPLILQHSDIEQARALAILTPDPAAIRAIIATARKLNPHLFIVARTRFLSETPYLLELGANKVIAEEFEASVGVFAHILDYYLLPRQKTQELIYKIRSENYHAFDSEEPAASLVGLANDLTELSAMSYAIEEGAKVLNKDLQNLALPKNYNISVLAIRRGAQTITTLHASTQLQVGDIVYIFGLQEDLMHAQKLFEGENTLHSNTLLEN